MVHVHQSLSVYHRDIWSWVDSSKMSQIELKGPGLLTITPTKCCMWTTYAKEVTLGNAAPFREKQFLYRESTINSKQ